MIHRLKKHLWWVALFVLAVVAFRVAERLI